MIFQPARFNVYREVSLQIREIFLEYTDLIEPLSLDEAFLDVTMNKKNITSATEIAMQIKQKIKEKLNLTASAGVSYNKFLAKIASDFRKPDGIFIIKPGQAEQVLSELEIGKFFGIGKVTAEKLRKMGIYKGKDLQTMDIASLTRMFGKSALFFYNLAHGKDDREVENFRIRKSMSVENTYEHDLTGEVEIMEALHNLENRLQKDLEKSDRPWKTVTVKIRFHDFRTITRSLSLPYYINDMTELKMVTRRILDEADIVDHFVRLMGVGISNFRETEELKYIQLKLDLFNC